MLTTQHPPAAGEGLIYPWNGALEYLVHKAAPALLAGCTVVMKSPTQAPSEACIIAKLIGPPVVSSPNNAKN